MSKAKRFEELTDDDLERIRRETLERDAVEPRARAVRYDGKKDQVIVELKNGVVLAVPTRLLQGVAGADPKLIAKVETDARLRPALGRAGRGFERTGSSRRLFRQRTLDGAAPRRRRTARHSHRRRHRAQRWQRTHSRQARRFALQRPARWPAAQESHGLSTLRAG